MTFRTRSRGTMKTTDMSTQQTSFNYASWTNSGTQYLYASGSTETMTDTITPGFRAKQKSGIIVMNPMTHTWQEAERMGGEGLTRRQLSNNNRVRDLGNQVENLYTVALGGSLTQGRLPPLYNLLGESEVRSILTQASTACLNQVGRNNSANLWETLAEADKSLLMLHDTFRNIRKAMKRRGVRGYDSLDLTSDTWLQYRYGLMPLIRDAAAVMKGLEAKVTRMRQSSRGFANGNKSETKVVTFNSSDQIVDILVMNTDSMIVRAMSLDEFIADRLYNLGFTAKGLLTLPLELVRYSFVLEWFVNVGDFLGALTPSPSFNNLGSCITVDRSQTTSITLANSRPGPGYVIDVAGSGSFMYTQRIKTRSAGLLRPGLVVKSDFRFNNLNRCLDSLALITQRLR